MSTMELLMFTSCDLKKKNHPPTNVNLLVIYGKIKCSNNDIFVRVTFFCVTLKWMKILFINLKRHKHTRNCLDNCIYYLHSYGCY